MKQASLPFERTLTPKPEATYDSVRVVRFLAGKPPARILLEHVNGCG
ncbi:MAG: hypothetical protein R3B07_09110 [Polyangiaceae bacterium]